jgi:4-amino-4-deoxy-L-arabinose transferase-like glycosyltransferase
MNRRNVFNLILGIAAIILLYTILLSVFVRTPQLTSYPSYILIIISTVLFLILFVALRLWGEVSIAMRYFVPILLLAVVVPRLIWVLTLDTKPVSDFAFYYNYAVSMSRGVYSIPDKTCIVFPHRIGFPLVLSVIIKIFGGSLTIIKIFNILVSCGLALILYCIGKETFNEKAGKAAGIVFAFWPSQIMYNSVVASENAFLLFFTLSILIYICLKKCEKLHIKIVLFILLIISISLSQFIRPIAIMLMPAFLVYELFSGKQNMNVKNILKILRNLAFIYAAYLLFFGMLSYVSYRLTNVNMFRSSPGYNLYVGTNYESSGLYNHSDANILREYNWDHKAVHQEAQRRAIERIFSRPIDFIRLLEKKFTIFWGDDSYGVSWSLAELSSSNRLGDFILAHKKHLIAISQIYYIITIFFAFIGCIFVIMDKKNTAIMIISIFLINVAAYSFLEIQSRYHYPPIALLLVVSSYGIMKLQPVINNFKSTVLSGTDHHLRL